MSKCPSCSSALAPGSRFCAACGSVVVAGGGAGAGAAADRPADVTTPLGPAATVPSRPSELSGTGSTAGARFLPGTMVADRYRIVGMLGRGGMGEVYRADDLKLGQPVALKFLPEGLDRDPQHLEQFLNEVRTARQVTHPNVCRVYDIGEVDGQHFLSMEYVDGEDLSSLLVRIGRLPRERAITVARQICAGLAAAHEQGILHRDLKPANVMIDGRGRVRLTDFGLAGIAESFAAGDARAGTPAYMAPEQLAGGQVSVRSDLYSLGLVLYELFTGQRVFRADTMAELRRMHESSAPSRPSTLVEGLDPAVERTLLHCLEKNPQDRPSSALAVSAALPGGDPLAAALAAGETPSPELVAEAGRKDALRPGVALLWAVVAFALFLGTTRWVGSQTDLHFLPLEKRPEVLMDRSREILRDLGFVEPAYTEPVGRAWGLISWETVFDQVAAADSSATRWEGLRSRPDAASYWYRQSPGYLFPTPDTYNGPMFLRPSVSLTNPPSTTAGGVSVVLDLAGRLRRLEVQPKRFATEDPSPVDWEPLFALAGLDPERFTEVPPRYQRYFAPDVRRAWTGTREDQPDVPLRIEAGGFQGRPVLFNVSTPASVESLAGDPEPDRPTATYVLARSSTATVALLIVGAALIVIRRNVSRGQADLRGARRFGLLLFGSSLLSECLKSPSLFSPWWAEELWPLLVASTFMGLVGWGMYAAAEPLGRRVWPTMFVSSSRLLSRPRVQWRDPLIGRSVLVGLVAGSVCFAWIGGLPYLLTTWMEGVPPQPHGTYFQILGGQRAALGWILNQTMTIGMSFMMVLALLVVRQLVKNRFATLAITVVVWSLFLGNLGVPETFVMAAGQIVMLAVLLRWGVVAFALLNVVVSLGSVARVTDLSAWYAEGAVMTLAIVGILTIYGFWASTRPTEAAGP